MMLSTKVKLSIGLIVLLSFVAFVSVPMAQPIKSRILEDVSIHSSDGGTELVVRFSFPLRYLRHFPEHKGRTLQIALAPLNISAIDRSLLGQRESARVPDELIDDVVDISYEGDMPGGPYLTLRFYQDLNFEVRPGSDFRSINIRLPEIMLPATDSMGE